MRNFVKSEMSAFWLLLLFCCIFSVAGIYIGVVKQDPLIGQRGGALSVAFSFFALFASRDYGTRVQKSIGTSYNELIDGLSEVRYMEQPEKNEQEIEKTKNLVEALSKRIDVDRFGELRQNYFIASSAFIGTIVWGFGDIFVNWLS